MTETSLNMTSANFALKELYNGQTVTQMMYKKSPLLAMLPKSTESGGKYIPIPVMVGASQGRSHDFATAQANQTAIEGAEFLLTLVEDYSIAKISNRLMWSSQTDKESFLRGSKALIDAAIISATSSIGSSIYRSGTGSIGLIATAGITSGVITLDDASSVTQFERNMTLQAAATDGGTPRAALGYVISVDRTAGTFTVASSGLGGIAASPSGWAAGDYILVQGDSNGKMSGLEAWDPVTTPSSTAFYGVDRSIDTRLGGLRYDGSALSIEEALTIGVSLAGREGAELDKAFMSFETWRALELSLGSKVQYVDLKGPADIMFRGIRVNGPYGEIACVPDSNAPGKVVRLLEMSSWTLHSVGDVPMILKYGDGLEMLRVYNSDHGEVRVGAYVNLGCSAPGHNLRLKVGA